MDFLQYCPKDGGELKPSRKIPLEGWKECPRCGSLIGEPDLENPYDEGVLLEPGRDFDPDPGRMRGLMDQARKGSGGSSNKGGSSKKPKRGSAYFPLPLPQHGDSIINKT